MIEKFYPTRGTQKTAREMLSTIGIVGGVIAFAFLGSVYPQIAVALLLFALVIAIAVLVWWSFAPTRRY